MKPNGFDPGRTVLFSFEPAALDGLGLPTGTAMPPPLRLCGCGDASDFGLPAAPLCSSVVKWSMARVYVPMPGIRFTVLVDEFRLFNELRELRRLLPLDDDRSTGLGAAARTTGTAGLGPVVLAAGLTDAATVTLAVGLCRAGCGVLKLLVLFGNSVLPAAGPTALTTAELTFFRGPAVTAATGPLLLLCVLVPLLLPLLSARAIVLGAGFSPSKLPDDVSWLSDSADIRLTDSSNLKNERSATVIHDVTSSTMVLNCPRRSVITLRLVTIPTEKFLCTLPPPLLRYKIKKINVLTQHLRAFWMQKTFLVVTRYTRQYITILVSARRGKIQQYAE